MTSCASSASIGAQDLSTSLDLKMISDTGSSPVVFITSTSIGAVRGVACMGRGHLPGQRKAEWQNLALRPFET